MTPPLRGAGLTLLFFLGLGMGSAILHAIAAPGGGRISGVKTAWYQENANQYDTVAIGTSRTYRSFIPDLFDREMAKHGKPTTSFNLGVPGATWLEIHFLSREILKAGNPHLKRLLIEYRAFYPAIIEKNIFKGRTVYWHDWPATTLAVQGIQNNLELARNPYRDSFVHLQHFLCWTLNIGQAYEIGDGLLGLRTNQSARAGASNGWIPLEADDANLAARRQLFLDHIDDFREDVRHMVEDEVYSREDVEAWHDLEIARSIIDAAEEADVEIVFVQMPGQGRDKPFEKRVADDLGKAVLLYNDPEKYPAFYDEEFRWDVGHLSESGSTIFTEILAEDVAAVLE
ncbi:MAG TPA: hypothetical protein DDW23_02210, partial [Planctomycetes bacterium]|nr:hypothetical protein [Planctomycetota bacterium]